MKTTVHNGKYKLVEKLGAGATSIVYKAIRVEDEHVCAVKILRHEYVSDEESVKRFMREADALMKLDHQNVVRVYDFGSEDDTFYIVMEYIEGETLKRVIRSAGILPEDTVIIVALQLCNALKQAHDNGIIHRDIKPQNILVTVAGIVKVADFGIARVNTSSTLTALGKDVLGSVHYISPEQARGSYLDKRSDIYSLGVTLYEMATGTLPFVGEDPLNVAMKHVNETAVAPKDVNPRLTTALSNIIIKCMSKEADRRYSDVSELKDDLLHVSKQPDGSYVKLFTDEIDDLPTQKMKASDIAERIIASGERSPEREPVAVADPVPEEEPEDEKKRIIKMSVLIAVALVLVVAVVALFIGVLNRNKPSSEVTVPLVVGMTQQDATKILQEYNLRVDYEEATSETVAAGRVMEQDPAADVTVERSSVVTLVISSGPVPVTPSPYISMPDLTNMTEQEALIRLRNLELVLGEVKREDSDKRVGYVIEQSISVGTELRKGDKVDITVSKGATIPDLTGLTIEEAQKKAQEKGYTISNITPVVNPDKKGKVASQTPAQNTVLDVSSGKPSIEITVGKFTQEIALYESDSIGGSLLQITHLDAQNQTVVDAEITISPDILTPESIAVDSLVAETKDYNIVLDGTVVRTVSVTFN